MSRVVLIIAGAAAAGVVSLLVTESKFAAANPGAVSQQTYAYGLVDPNANGRGTPGFVFQENMASVRRVGVGRYCLRGSVHFDTGPVIIAAADGKLTNGRYGLAISDLGNRACNKKLQEVGVDTFIIIYGRARASNTVRFVGDTIG